MTSGGLCDGNHEGGLCVWLSQVVSWCPEPLHHLLPWAIWKGPLELSHNWFSVSAPQWDFVAASPHLQPLVCWIHLREQIITHEFSAHEWSSTSFTLPTASWAAQLGSVSVCGINLRTKPWALSMVEIIHIEIVFQCFSPLFKKISYIFSKSFWLSFLFVCFHQFSGPLLLSLQTLIKELLLKLEEAKCCWCSPLSLESNASSFMYNLIVICSFWPEEQTVLLMITHVKSVDFFLIRFCTAHGPAKCVIYGEWAAVTL